MVSSIHSFKSAYYMIKVSLALIIDRFSIHKVKRRQGMTPQLQLFMVLGALVLLCIIFTLLKRGLTSVKYSLLWLLLAVALVIAAARLLPRPDASMTRQFQRSASLLLKSLGGMDLSSKPKIRFTDEAMQIKTNQKSADFPYEKMETLVETPSLFLLTHSGSATVLQKKDLILGTPEEFLDFFRAHAACPCAKLTEE